MLVVDKQQRTRNTRQQQPDSPFLFELCTLKICTYSQCGRVYKHQTLSSFSEITPVFGVTRTREYRFKTGGQCLHASRS